MRFTTVSGSTYEWDTDADTLTRMRTDEDAVLRRDGEPVPILMVIAFPTVGYSAQFILQVREDAVPTVRTTTEVVELIA